MINGPLGWAQVGVLNPTYTAAFADHNIKLPREALVLPSTDATAAPGDIKLRFRAPWERPIYYGAAAAVILAGLAGFFIGRR